MDSPGTGALRVARAFVLATAGLLLGIGGHLAGGGRPPAAAVLVVAALSAASFGLLADRRLGWPAICSAMAASQVGFHLLMSLQPSTDMSMNMPMPMPAGQSHAGNQELRMLLAHVVATALATWLLCAGEGLVWTVAALLAPVLLPELAPVGPPSLPRHRNWAPVGDRAVRPLGLVEVGLRHRGPPRSAAA